MISVHSSTTTFPGSQKENMKAQSVTVMFNYNSNNCFWYCVQGKCLYLRFLYFSYFLLWWIIKFFFFLYAYPLLFSTIFSSSPAFFFPLLFPCLPPGKRTGFVHFSSLLSSWFFINLFSNQHFLASWRPENLLLPPYFFALSAKNLLLFLWHKFLKFSSDVVLHPSLPHHSHSHCPLEGAKNGYFSLFFGAGVIEKCQIR